MTASEFGYLGAFLIISILIGAFAVSYKFHVYRKSTVLYFSFLFLVAGSVLLFWYEALVCLSLVYIFIGIAIGLATSGVNALMAQFTSSGKRYQPFAKMYMFADTIRILYPLIAGGMYTWRGFSGLIWFALLTVFCFGLLLFLFQQNYSFDEEVVNNSETKIVSELSIKYNTSFWRMIVLEFLDSFASSQLFVFLPALLIFKNFTIENALIMQSVIFFGYLTGRWLVGWLAHRFNGFIAVAIGEMGMVGTIVLLLIVPASPILYGLCFLLGVCLRGTSPVIKALAFDRLHPKQIKQGSAIHVIGGDGGSAVGQLIFGFLLAWFGVKAPFIAGAIGAGVVGILCVVYRYNVHRSE